MEPDHDVHARRVSLLDARPRPRLALEPEDATWGWSGELLIQSHLRRNGPRNDRWVACTPAERDCIARLIEHVIDTRGEIIQRYDMQHEVLDAFSIWSDRAIVSCQLGERVLLTSLLAALFTESRLKLSQFRLVARHPELDTGMQTNPGTFRGTMMTSNPIHKTRARCVRCRPDAR